MGFPAVAPWHHGFMVLQRSLGEVLISPHSWLRKCDPSPAPHSHSHSHSRPRRVVSVSFIGSTSDLITASHDGTARVWDGERGRCMHVLKGHTGERCLGARMPCDVVVVQVQSLGQRAMGEGGAHVAPTSACATSETTAIL